MVYIWNERQLIWDQLLLSNPASRAPNPLTPLNDRDFQKYAALYADQVLMKRLAPTNPALRRAIPADILWLFRRSPQTTRGPFAVLAQNTLLDITLAALPANNLLTQALINHCLATPNKDFTFTTLADLKMVFDINRLRLPKTSH